MFPRTSMRVWYTRGEEENCFDFIVDLVFGADTPLRKEFLDTVVADEIIRQLVRADRGLKDQAYAINHKVEVGSTGVGPSNADRLAALGISAVRYEYQEQGKERGDQIQAS